MIRFAVEDGQPTLKNTSLASLNKTFALYLTLLGPTLFVLFIDDISNITVNGVLTKLYTLMI